MTLSTRKRTYSNNVFIATSLDGFIADSDGGIDWLHEIDNPDQLDMGYAEFMQDMDALLMGRKTYDTVRSFDMDWPYSKPVFVLSKSIKEVPPDLNKRVFIVNGKLIDVLTQIHERGYQHLYIDGGQTIQNFLSEDLIDRMVITRIPTLLGSGVSLFGELRKRLDFECVKSEIFLNSVVQNTFVRKR